MVKRRRLGYSEEGKTKYISFEKTLKTFELRNVI